MFVSIWLVGLIVVLFSTYKVCWWIYVSFFKPIDLKKYRKGQSWAVVTGATDGIGLAYAQVLAEHGFNILLVSRSKEKLEDVKSRIQQSTKVQVDYVVSNAIDATEKNVQTIVDKVGTRDVSILVNNVGIGLGGLMVLDQHEAGKIEDAIKVNCLFPTLLTRAMIPVLLRHQGPKLMINLSSVVALIMNPFSSVYSATKGYNRQFSLALSAEYHRQGLEVLCVEPGFVESSMTNMKPSMICCTARECVESSLRKIGEVEIIPHWKHMLMYVATIWYKLLPSQFIPPTVYSVVSTLRVKTGRLNAD